MPARQPVSFPLVCGGPARPRSRVACPVVPG